MVSLLFEHSLIEARPWPVDVELDAVPHPGLVHRVSDGLRGKARPDDEEQSMAVLAQADAGPEGSDAGAEDISPGLRVVLGLCGLIFP